jgi:hypothetical protein
MTRDQITTIVTQTVGQVDATSIALCNDYVQRGYELVWNAHLWRDTVTIDTSATVSAGTNTFSLPSGFDRVVSLQLLAGGVPVGFLDPTSSSFILQTEPNALTVQGVPTKYEEFVHTDGTKKVRLFPVPNASYTLTMSGKRVCPTLTGADSLQIRNVDNAVIALACGDMYQRMRHLGKAAEMAKKAGALIEEARMIEAQGSNLPRQSKNLTVAGNTLAEMADAVCARTGQWGLESVILAKEFLRRNYQMVYDMALWTESTVEIDRASVLGVLILPEFVDRVIAIRGNANLGQLSAAQPSIFFGINPWIFEQTGDPLAFSYLSPVALPVLPTTAEQLRFASTNANDKSPVTVNGETSGGTIIIEQISLNGTTPVVTTNAYSVPLSIGKRITLGHVSITGNTSVTLFATLLDYERERKHVRIQLRPTPTANVTCKILGKRRIIPLLTDEDTPLLRDIGNVLINLAAADMFSKLGNAPEAAATKNKADEAIKILIDLEKQQGAITAQVVPEVEPSGDWEWSDSWHVAKV